MNNRVVAIAALVLLLPVVSLADSDSLSVTPISQLNKDRDLSWKPVPITFSLEYSIFSDYVLRGQTLTDRSGEGHEDLNHSFSLLGEYNCGDGGALGAQVWFEWWRGLEFSSASGIDDAQHTETDYRAYYRRMIEPIYSEVEIGWIARHFPHFHGGIGSTQEIYAAIRLDDSFLFGTEDPVLNPYVLAAYDYDLIQGMWIEVGISHPFDLSELEATEDIPCLNNMVVTPSVKLGFDHRYWSKLGAEEGVFTASGDPSASTRCANIEYGLEARYNLGRALNMDDKCGTFFLTGYLYYTQDLWREAYDNELYGGIKLTYLW